MDQVRWGTSMSLIQVAIYLTNIMFSCSSRLHAKFSKSIYGAKIRKIHLWFSILRITLLGCGKYIRSPDGTWKETKVCMQITESIKLHWLCAVSNTWTVPQTVGDAPCAREGHSAAVIGTRMYIFGGCGKLTHDSDDSYFNDLYFLETSNCSYFLSLWIFLGVLCA